MVLMRENYDNIITKSKKIDDTDNEYDEE